MVLANVQLFKKCTSGMVDSWLNSLALYAWLQIWGLPARFNSKLFCIVCTPHPFEIKEQ